VLFDVLEDNHDMALSHLTSMSQWALALSEKLAERQAPALAAPG
jgi:hypothetical protein